jgi:hypothetical protein
MREASTAVGWLAPSPVGERHCILVQMLARIHAAADATCLYLAYAAEHSPQSARQLVNFMGINNQWKLLFTTHSCAAEMGL